MTLNLTAPRGAILIGDLTAKLLNFISSRLSRKNRSDWSRLDVLRYANSIQRSDPGQATDLYAALARDD